jgi:hypothetical protein
MFHSELLDELRVRHRLLLSKLENLLQLEVFLVHLTVRRANCGCKVKCRVSTRLVQHLLLKEEVLLEIHLALLLLVLIVTLVCTDANGFRRLFLR